MNDFDRAIRDMEDARSTHVAWRDFMLAGGDPVATYKDNVTYERKWIARYDNVLRVLRKTNKEKSIEPFNSEFDEMVDEVLA